MAKLFVKVRDPVFQTKISIPLEVPEGYDFWIIAQQLNLILKSMEWDNLSPEVVKKKKK